MIEINEQYAKIFISWFFLFLTCGTLLAICIRCWINIIKGKKGWWNK